MTSNSCSPRSLILVSEKPERHLESLQQALAASGTCLTRKDWALATEAVREDPPSLVLIDSQDGPERAVELCRELREAGLPHLTPIVMLHDGGDAEWFEAACDAGATEFLEDPIHPSLLERRLDSALAYVEGLVGSRLLAEDPGAEFASPRTIATPAVFPRLVSVAVEQARQSGKSVCVLSVRLSAGGRELGEEFGHYLGRAVREFEEEGPISHPKGKIVISRVQPERYALMVPELERIQDAARLGYRIHEFLSQECGEHQVAAHIGISTSPGDGHDGATLLEQADQAAAIAQQDDSHSLSFRTESTNRWVFERLTLERSLRNAIELDELTVYYQPKVNIDTRAVVGFEALVRWQHPELGMVSPAQFIPLAEETGLIVPIGEWVLETACAQRQAWESAGFAPPIMAVNLSAVQFRQAELCETIAAVLERTGMPADKLELEVTESMLMHDLKDTVNTLQRLKASGIHLSIDDFGTGYSSLSYLKGFPIDALKIDRSFVRDITANADDAAIATSIILMGRSLNMKVIAEGVETENQLAFLKVLQCDEIQGYLISPPVPAEKAESFLVRR